MIDLEAQVRQAGERLDEASIRHAANLLPDRGVTPIRVTRSRRSWVMVAAGLVMVAVVAGTAFAVLVQPNSENLVPSRVTVHDAPTPPPVTVPPDTLNSEVARFLGVTSVHDIKVTVLAFQGENTNALVSGIGNPPGARAQVPAGERRWTQEFRNPADLGGASLILSTRLDRTPIPCDGCTAGEIVDLGNGRRVALGPSDLIIGQAFIDLGEGWYPVALSAQGLAREQILDVARQLVRRPDHGVDLPVPPVGLVQVAEGDGAAAASDPSTKPPTLGVRTSVNGQGLSLETVWTPAPTGDPSDYLETLANGRTPCLSLSSRRIEQITIRGNPGIVLTCDPGNRVPPGSIPIVIV